MDTPTQKPETKNPSMAGMKPEAEGLEVSESLEGLEGFDRLDRQEGGGIPQAWEIEPQLSLEGFNIADASDVDRTLYCKYLLGELQARFRAIREQGHRVHERILSDADQGYHAMAKINDDESAEGERARQIAIDGVTNWFYQDGQDEKETVPYIAATGCSARTMGAIQELNREKAGFKHYLGCLREALGGNTPSRNTLLTIINHIAPHATANVQRQHAGKLVRQLLHDRLNIRQLVRQIPVIENPPVSIRWRWVLTPSTIRISRGDLLAHLEKRCDNPVAAMDYHKIAATPDSVFCWHKGDSLDCRIHARCLQGETQKRCYAAFKSRMPVFYLERRLASGQLAPPELTVVPTEAQRHEREKRVDPDRFLDTMAIHRYFDPPGNTKC